MTDIITSTSLYGTLEEFAKRGGYVAGTGGAGSLHSLTEALLAKLGASSSSPVAVYSYNGVDNLSMNQLMMAICLERGNQLELQTVELMEKMTDTTGRLKRLARLEEMVLEAQEAGTSLDLSAKVEVSGESLSKTVKEVLDENGITIQFSGEQGRSPLSGYQMYGSDISDAAMNTNIAMLNQLYATSVDTETRECCFWMLQGGWSWMLTSFSGDVVVDASTVTHSVNGLDKSLAQILEFLEEEAGVDVKWGREYASSVSSADMEQLLTDIEAKMDSLNTVSQEDMIDLQALVNKRDQTYTLLSNASKLMSNLSLSIVNNL